MGIILDTLRKTDPSVQDCTAATINPTTARTAFAKTVGGYGESGHDTAPEIDALGSMSGDASEQEDSDQDEISLDASTFDAKVRELVQNAGFEYNYKAAAQAGLMKRVNPEVIAALRRLEKNAPLLNRAVAIARARQCGRASASRLIKAAPL